MTVAALVLAAGRGERFGGEVPKALAPLAGRTLLAHSALALAASPAVDHVLPVVPAALRDDLLRRVPELAGLAKALPAVAGGEARQDSVVAGLAALPPGTAWVAVHDAARPLVRPQLVTAVVEAARRHGAAIPAVPVTDTLKRVADGVVVDTPDRSGFQAAQTPQAFALVLLREALAKARADGRVGTDDASLVEALGVAVHVVPGDPANRKITVAADRVAAEAWLSWRDAPAEAGTGPGSDGRGPCGA
jgi:2-C-methyl-D-erythritol 4-phosphate cytidylyltransferase